MPYIITILNPVYSKTGASTSPTGRTYDLEPYSERTVVTLDEAIEAVEGFLDDAQDALGEEEGARAYFAPARDSVMALDEDGGRVELPDGWVAEVKRA